MQTEVLSADYPNVLHHALDVLNHGGVVGFPTDTVYGLGALPARVDSIERLYTIKGRSRTKAIAILIAAPTDLDLVTSDANQLGRKLAEAFWPGPMTLIVPRHPSLPEIISTTNTVGVRMPDHPVSLGLLRLTGPLAVTSANLTGEENTCTAKEVLEQLKGRFHLLIDGGSTPGGVPSTVVDCTGVQPVILREGPISEAQVLKVIAA
jgi:L-threonylcarbamoyladenylate synthase